MEELELAKKIVRNAFVDKKDKAGMPYMGHLVRVSDKMPNNSLRTIALLHDLLEDCPEWTEKALRHIFLEVIVDTLVLLTRGKSETYSSYIAKIKTDDWATIVKIADLEDNLNLARLTDINQIDIKRIEKYVIAYNQLTAKN